MFIGSLVAMVTPMLSDGSVDYKSAQKLVDMHISANTDGLVILGSTGEGTMLEHEEKLDFIRAIKDFSMGKIPVIVGCSGNSTAQTVQLAKSIDSIGVDGLLVPTPAYSKPTQNGLILHFTKIAQAVDLPIILYNNPPRAACDLISDSVIELSKLDNVISIKESSGELSRVSSILENATNGFVVLSGDDQMTLDMISKGASGVISVSCNVVPKLIKSLVDSASIGDIANAKLIDQKISCINEKLFVESNPIPVKWAMWRLGLIDDGIRLPLTRLSENYYTEIENALDGLDLRPEGFKL